MTEAQIAEKMVVRSRGNAHDTAHFMRVWAWARTVGMLEGLDEKTQFILEAASIVHDIACPLCREKYGSTNGKYQELEGGPLARAFLEGCGLPAADVERIVYLVAHHHTYANVDGPDYQILLEADYLANAAESDYTPGNLNNALERIFRTEAGKALLRSVFAQKLARTE